MKIKQFEQVAAAPSVALLRITGKAARRRAAEPGERPTLVADDGQKVTRFEALPSPPDDRGVLRAAYSVPAAVITPETVFSLELTDGHIVALPAPVSRAGSRPAAAASPTPPAPDPAAAPIAPPVPPPAPTPVPAADPQAEEAHRAELADANRRAEEALLEAAAARDQREALEQRNSELSDSLRERQAALDELEVWRGELERRLASMSTELGDAKARLRAAEEELNALRPPPAEAGGDLADAGPADAAVDLEEVRRRAAAEAGELAARELAEAAGEAPDPGL